MGKDVIDSVKVCDHGAGWAVCTRFGGAISQSARDIIPLHCMRYP
jgi:hypothetical protein